jgi:uncharacterized protein
MSLTFIVLLILLGTFVGVAAGLLGIGGGGILVPMLSTLFLWQGFPKAFVVHLALGTSMACIMLTSISSMHAHHKNGAVIWSIAKIMAPSVIIGTFFATFLVAILSPKTLAIIFAVFMSYVAFSMFISKKATNAPVTDAKSITITIPKIEAMLVSMGIGAVSAVVSIGGGSLTVPYLNWRDVNIKHAIGTSAALGFPIALAGTIGYGWNGFMDNALQSAQIAHAWGYVYLPALLFVAVPSFLTARIGANLTQSLPVAILKRIFGSLLLLLSLKMLWSTL